MRGLDLINKAFAAYVSDIYVRGGKVWFRAPDGVVEALAVPGVTREDVAAFVETVNAQGFLPANIASRFEREKVADFAATISDPGSDVEIRLRVHAFYTRKEPAFAIRIIPPPAKSLEDIGLEKNIENRVRGNKGLFLVTGPTGAGKTTTLATLIQNIVLHEPVHVLTFEDPIEYVIRPGRGLVHQRELHEDFPSFPEGLRSALRESPDVILVGEVRDLETLRWTLTLAEAGFLVLASFHARSPQEAVERIVGSFPEYEQNQAKVRLGTTLIGILSQVLLPASGSHGAGRRRVVAYEYIFADPALRTVIKEDKTQTIPNMITSLTSKGMGIRYEDTLARLVRVGLLKRDAALAAAPDPKLLEAKLRQDA